MIDPSEVPLDRTPPPAAESIPHRSAVPWIIGAVVLLLGGVAVWYFMAGRGGSETSGEQLPAPAAELLVPAHAPAVICAAGDDIPLPPLDESDGIAGTLATALSRHPRAVAWMATDDLIRRFVATVDAVAAGKSPALYLSALRPAGAFRTAERGDELLLDPRSFQRYAPIVEAVESVDVEATARVCSALKPRLDDAYAELKRGGTFDEALEAAIVSILRTPVLDASVSLVPQGAGYGFEDPALEGLTPAQKHLARMGPVHTRAIQAKVRAIAVAIGIPAERLP